MRETGCMTNRALRAAAKFAKKKEITMVELGMLVPIMTSAEM